MFTTSGKIDDKLNKTVQAAIVRDSFLSFTIAKMHEYIHNKYLNPAPSDLRVGWDNLEAFIRTIWEN